MADPAPPAPAPQPDNAATSAVSQAGDDVADGLPMYALQSLCMRCGEQGTTRMLLTQIPHFREIMVMAFHCPHCGESNNEAQCAGTLAPQGAKWTLTVAPGDSQGLDRQVVKSKFASIRIPELDFEIPPDTQKGSLSTVEGVLSKAAADLGTLQEERRKVDPATAEKLDAFLQKLEACSKGKVSFTLELNDPSGNSFVQTPCAPAPDPQMKIAHYDRTPEDNERLGYQPGPAGEPAPANGTATAKKPTEKKGYVPTVTSTTPHGAVGALNVNQAIAAECSPEQAEALLSYSTPEEVMTFPAHCSACGAPSETRMYVTNIPSFKEVIIMSTACEACGFRSSELKAGSAISEKGKRICLLVKSAKDLTRDVIKSDSAVVAIPELELELTAGTLGGEVTTVEGLVTQIEENLGKVFPFQIGSCAPVWQRAKWADFLKNLKALTEVKAPWHLIIDDALANSFIAPASGKSMENDPLLATEEYVRSWEQDEELGLHDMDTGEKAEESVEGGGVDGKVEARMDTID